MGMLRGCMVFGVRMVLEGWVRKIEGEGMFVMYMMGLLVMLLWGG